MKKLMAGNLQVLSPSPNERVTSEPRSSRILRSKLGVSSPNFHVLTTKVPYLTLHFKVPGFFTNLHVFRFPQRQMLGSVMQNKFISECGLHWILFRRLLSENSTPRSSNNLIAINNAVPLLKNIEP